MRRLLIWLTSLILVGLTTGCGTPPKLYELHPNLQNTNLPPLLSIEDFFDSRENKFNFKVSPDGTKLAWSERYQGRPQIHFKTIGEEKIGRIVATNWRIYSIVWAQDSRHFFVHGTSGGKENTRVYVFDMKYPHAKPKMISKFEGYMTSQKRASVVMIPQNDPEHVLVSMNDRDSTFFDLYKIGISGQGKELIAQNPGDVASWITDKNGKLYGRIRRDEDTGSGGVEIYQPEDGSWRKVADMGLSDFFWAKKFDSEKKHLWALSNRNRDKVALVRFNLANGHEELIYEHPQVDVAFAYVSDVTSKPVGVIIEPDYPELHFLDPDVKNNFEPLMNEMRDKGYKGLTVLSSDNTDKLFTLRAYTEKHYAYYFFDSSTGAVELLDSVSPKILIENMAEMKPIVITSRDGWPLHGYLTLPPGAEHIRLPMVLRVHGGPWSRDHYGFNREVQFLANRGYAVLQINFRGSRGYGRAFMEAAKGEFAGKMHDDLIDAVRWAVKQGFADESRIAIYGGSYGGYATLVGLTFTPDVFACGIDIFGPSNLVSLMQNFPQWWKFGLPQWREYVGNIDDPQDVEIMKAKSPFFKVDKIMRPLLIIYGSGDQRVSKKESEKMIAVLQKAGKQVEWHRFVDEGHGITKGTNRFTYYKLIEDFLARHLGGRKKY